MAVGLVALVSLFASGCDNGQAWIARVDGQAIRAPHFAEGVGYWNELSGSAQTGAPPTTQANGVTSMSGVQGYALLLVQAHAIEQFIDKLGITVTDADREQTRTALLTQSQGGVSLKDKPKWFQDQIVDLQTNFTALVNHYAKGVDQDAAARKFYDENTAAFDQYCVDVIQTADEASAAAARKRVDDGEDFATVAREVAKDSGTEAAGEKKDGDVGCIPVSQFQQVVLDKGQLDDLTKLEDGKVGGPYSATGGAYLIVRKRETKTQSFEEAKPTIVAQLGTPGEAAASAALNRFLKTADIELNPRYGTWTNGVGYAEPAGAEQPQGAPTTSAPVQLAPQ